MPAGGGGGKDRLKSGDYRGWDKFNVEEECDRVDQEKLKDKESPSAGKTGVPISLSESGKSLVCSTSICHLYLCLVRIEHVSCGEEESGSTGEGER